MFFCLLHLVFLVSIYTLRGGVATEQRCDGILINHFIANCPENAPVKKKLKIKKSN